MWEWPAVVQDVHDGDTITVRIDRGFDDRKEDMKLRLEGVYAPELHQPGGPETRQFVIDWVKAASISAQVFPLVVTTVRLKNGKRERKTLERYVARVDTVTGISLNKVVADFVAERGYPRGVGG
jgi:endonuclease YncB( thermonuclease family)